MGKKTIKVRLVLLTLLLLTAFTFANITLVRADENEDSDEIIIEDAVIISAEVKSCIAQLHFESGDGKYSNISENAEIQNDAPGSCYVKVEGGTFTTTLNAKDLVPEGTEIQEKITGVKVLCIDISGIKQLLNEYNLKYDVSDVEVSCDGTPIELDSHKLVLGSAEENDNLRIEIFNASGATAGENSPINSEGFEFEDKLSVTFTLKLATKGQDGYIVFANSKGRYFSTAEKPKSDPLVVNGDGTYSVGLEAIDSEGDKVKVSGITNFYIEIPGLASQITDWTSLRVTDVSITCDGEPVEIDSSEIYWGNTKNNGSFRIDFYDEEKANAEYKGALDRKNFNFRDKMIVTFNIEGLTVGFPEEVTRDFIYFEPLPDEEVVDEPENVEVEDGMQEPEITEEPKEPEEVEITPSPTPTLEPTPSPTPVPLRGLNDTSYDKAKDKGIGVLGKVGIALGIIIVLGGGVAALIFGKEK